MTLRRILCTLAVLIFLLGAHSIYYALRARGFAEIRQPGEFVEVSAPGDARRRLHYICIGEGQPTVIFESSAFSGADGFAQARQEISKRTRVCSYDRAGMGLSDPGPSIMTAGFLAGDIERFIEHAHLAPPFILVPSSFGGIPAELFARLHPEQVLGLQCSQTRRIASWRKRLHPDHGLGPRRLHACSPRRRRSECLIWRTRWRWPTQKRKGSSIAGSRCPRSARSLAASLRASRNSKPPRRHTDVPLTVLVHERPDGLLPPKLSSLNKDIEPRWLQAQQQFAARSSRGTWKIVPGSDHLIANSQPHAVANAVLEMIAAQNPAR